MNENKVRVVVTDSHCPRYKVGDSIYFDGAIIDKDKSDNLCMMALNAIFPFVYAARKGIIREKPIQCPDCGDSVVFVIEIAE